MCTLGASVAKFVLHMEIWTLFLRARVYGSHLCGVRVARGVQVAWILLGDDHQKHVSVPSAMFGSTVETR